MNNDFKNKKILVMGLGLHGGGVAVAKWLAKKGAKVTVTDLRSKKILNESVEKLQKHNIKFVLGKHRANDFKINKIIVQNPGVPNNSPFLKIARDAGNRIINEATLFFDNNKSKNIIGVTGTRGKSTTASLIYKIIKKGDKRAVLAGNIRETAMLDVVDKIQEFYPVVLELSSWQLEGLNINNKSPNISILTNIYKDHLNRYSSFAEYIKAKENIIKYQTNHDFAILNYDNQILRKMGKKYEKIGRNVYWFSLNEKVRGCYIKNNWIYFEDEKILPLKNIKILGKHNLENILATVACAKILDISNKIIKKEVADFRGIANRLEFIAKKNSVTYINDTTATSPDAVVAALKALSEQCVDSRFWFDSPLTISSRVERRGNDVDKFIKKIILIAGGVDKNLDFSEMVKEINKHVKLLILFKGTASDKILQKVKSPRPRQGKIEGGQKSLPRRQAGKVKIMSNVKSMSEAVMLTKLDAVKNDIVLLSPGAASFGLFLHEFDRGAQFVKEVLDSVSLRSNKKPIILRARSRSTIKKKNKKQL